jgi:acyl dehydratase
MAKSSFNFEISLLMIDSKFKGYTTAPSFVKVDAWRIKLFCKSIGEINPIYYDEKVAQAAGHKTCPIPPTFLKAIETEHFSSAELLKVLMVPMGKVLHAEQSFSYSGMVYVGDDVEMSRTITDIYEKRGGAMIFILIETNYRVQTVSIAKSIQTIVIRNTKVLST